MNKVLHFLSIYNFLQHVVVAFARIYSISVTEQASDYKYRLSKYYQILGGVSISYESL